MKRPDCRKFLSDDYNKGGFMPKNKGYLQRTLEFHKIYEEEISAAIWIPFYRYRADNSSNAESHGDSDFR